MRPFGNRAFVNQLLVYTLVMISLTGSIGLGTVWLRHQISVTANSTRVLEASVAEVERSMAETTIRVAAEETLEALTRRNAEWRLGLMPPLESQVQRVAISPERRLAALRNQEVFSDRPADGSGVVIFRVGGGVERR
jgi:hypothetical protein